jgi:hypothetical protein
LTKPRTTYLAKVRNPNPECRITRNIPCPTLPTNSKGAFNEGEDGRSRRRKERNNGRPMTKRHQSASAAAVELERVPLVANQRGPGWLSDRIAGVIEGETRVVENLLCHQRHHDDGLLHDDSYLMSTGVGVWGLGHPVMWGWAIVNFVWWIGIGHAGTLISAILFLLRQRWRTSINRAAEAMTIFAVMCAGIFPLIHIGRIWFGWWLFPIPNSNSIWPQFRSPLMWDVFAVSTYFTVSVLFWYMGLIPDLAVMRDRAKTKIRKFGYGLFALGLDRFQPPLEQL